MKSVSINEAARLMLRAADEKKRLIVSLDGPCASGKTTLAGRLAQLTNAYQVHTDDYVVPHSMKTEKRLSVPGGNCHSERLISDVLKPFSEGNEAYVRRYSCCEDRLLDAEKVTGSILLLEGSYCNLPEIRAYCDIRFFLPADEEIRLQRLERRESPQSLARFKSRWIPLENAYFEAFSLPDEGCITVTAE